MIEIEIKAGRDPHALAELIAQTSGQTAPDPRTSIGAAAALVRSHQQDAERLRLAPEELDTVNFATIDDDLDWTDI